MLSLYLHIPFCEKKCSYCSFQVCPQDVTNPDVWEDMLDSYTNHLKDEIIWYASFFGNKNNQSASQEIFTIYFGGGTPSLLGSERIISVLDVIDEYFDIENLVELSIELNPYPADKIYSFVDAINIYAKKFSRIRYSFGIQSLDNTILSRHQRPSSFTGIVDFLRGLRKYKRDNVLFNLDFIAFGEFNTTTNGELALWNDSAREFYNDLVESHFIDSFSLYTLELFPGSLDFYEKKRDTLLSEEDGISQPLPDKEELISDEFGLLKQVVEEEGYHRYELSNFALPGKSSIHNHVYRTMENYLGLGTSASGFVNDSLLKNLTQEERDKLLSYWGAKTDSTTNLCGVRWTNTLNFESYAHNDKRVTMREILDERAYLIDEFFLIMRTSGGVKDLRKYVSILVENYQTLLSSFAKEGLVYYDADQGTLSLSDEGMNVYNSIITDIVDF